MTSAMAKAFIIMRIKINSLVIGRMTNSMVLVFTYSSMVNATKVNYVMELNMVKELTSMSMETNTRENGEQIEKMVMVSMIIIVPKRNMMDNG